MEAFASCLKASVARPPAPGQLRPTSKPPTFAFRAVSGGRVEARACLEHWFAWKVIRTCQRDVG